MLIFFKWV